MARLEGPADRISILESATTQRNFTRSMEAAKAAVPNSLYVDCHYPFQLLYDACGVDGVHEYTDQECIQRSAIIRSVLSPFAKRASAVLPRDEELRAAVGALVNAGSKTPKAS